MAFPAVVSPESLTLVGSVLAAAAPGGSLDKLVAILPWLVCVVAAVLGLFVYGLADVIRLSAVRIWAISSVCQTEAIRKKVLWVSPLAIVGVVVVSLFYHPAGAQETVRQITKFCLFTSGLLVTITAIILACTNLPREIENRVIYTIVTKPTTRLEIVLGKVLGFARVSGLILIIMGLFTLIYLEIRVRPMIADLKQQLATLPPQSPKLASLKYYVNSGLLGTRSLDWPNDMQIFARAPDGSDKRWMLGGEGLYFLIDFNLTSEQLELLDAATDKTGVSVQFKLDSDIVFDEANEDQLKEAHELGVDTPNKAKGHEVFGPVMTPAKTASTTGPATAPAKPTLVPKASVVFLDSSRHVLGVSGRDSGLVITLAPTGPGKPFSGTVELPKLLLRMLRAAGRFTAQVNALTPATEFGIGPEPVSIIFPGQNPQDVPPIEVANSAGDPSKPDAPVFLSFPARHGLRLTAANPLTGGPVAWFEYKNTPVTPSAGGKVALQVAASIEHNGDFSLDEQHLVGLADASVEVVNTKTGESSGPVRFSPETSQSEPVEVPAKYFAGGDFQVLLRNTTPKQYLGVIAGPGGAMAVVAADRSFVINLVKSLLVLWLLSVLVVIIAVFSSTFLSWPIAVVFTLLLLLGHWGVDELGDSLKPGASHNMVSTFGLRDPATISAFTSGMEQLSALMRTASNLMPDVSRFPVTEDIAIGVSIPLQKMLSAAGVVVCYGVPLLVFSYVILRRKEVAP